MDCPHCKVPLMRGMNVCPKCKYDIKSPYGGDSHLQWFIEHGEDEPKHLMEGKKKEQELKNLDFIRV